MFSLPFPSFPPQSGKHQAKTIAPRPKPRDNPPTTPTTNPFSNLLLSPVFGNKMDSATDKNDSGSQPRAQEAHIEASPVTLTPDGSVGSVANTDGMSIPHHLSSLYIST